MAYPQPNGIFASGHTLLDDFQPGFENRISQNSIFKCAGMCGASGLIPICSR